MQMQWRAARILLGDCVYFFDSNINIRIAKYDV